MNITKDTKVWLVTKPTKESTLDDILSECDLSGLRFQFLGGLVPLQINGLYKSKRTATKIANELLQMIKKI